MWFEINDKIEELYEKFEANKILSNSHEALLSEACQIWAAIMNKKDIWEDKRTKMTEGILDKSVVLASGRDITVKIIE